MGSNNDPQVMEGPTAKEKKYDRQLRLWGANGQEDLENSHVLLLNSGPGVVGVETLKNLILPGIGHYTIVDIHDPIVTWEDLGVNFFLDESCLGKPRAQMSCDFLQKHNPSVNGHWMTTEQLHETMASEEKLDQYTIFLIVSPIDHIFWNEIGVKHCNQTKKPLINILSIGFYSHFSISYPSTFPIVDTHPDPATVSDLRLVKPWKELQEYAAKKTEHLDSMNDHDHGHVPWLLLILHYLEQWKLSHDRKVPSIYKEKTAFRQFLLDHVRVSNSAGVEENFEQAAGAVLKSLNDPSPNSAVRKIWEDPQCDPSESSADFWFMACGVRKFFKDHGAMPLSGTLPDMKAQSSDYIELQNIYKSKAMEDVNLVTSNIRHLERDFPSRKPISLRDITAFCKNSQYMQMIPDKRIEEKPRTEFDVKFSEYPTDSEIKVSHLRENRYATLLYVAFAAYEQFFYTFNRKPGDSSPDGDAETLKSLMLVLFKQLLTTENFEPDDIDVIQKESLEICEELTRAGGGELHVISALTGGMVAQEAIKVITKQYVPINKDCVFDGIRSTTTVLSFSKRY